MSEISTKQRLNEIFIDVLERLSTLMMKKGEVMRSRAYTKAQETIMNINEDIHSVNDLKGKPNIGPTIIEKLNEYINTGTLRLFEREKNNPIILFTDIYGVGPKKAKELVEKNIISIQQLRENQDSVLNDIQKVGLKYYEDILKRIPRDEIDEYNIVFKKAFEKVFVPGSKYEIVGSYRRGAATSGDIDVIITSPNPSVFSAFIDELKRENIIKKILSRGKSKCLVITNLNDSSTPRRVDFLYSTPEEYPFAVLYFTGSKSFNTAMRSVALSEGYSLNEYGLYTKKPKKEKEEKVVHDFKTEKDIFDFLHLQYQPPNMRIDGRYIVMGVPSLVFPDASLLPPSREITEKVVTPPKAKAEKKTRKKRSLQGVPWLISLTSLPATFTEKKPRKPYTKKTLKKVEKVSSLLPTTPPPSLQGVSPQPQPSNTDFTEKIITPPKKEKKTRKKRSPNKEKKSRKPYTKKMRKVSPPNAPHSLESRKALSPPPPPPPQPPSPSPPPPPSIEAASAPLFEKVKKVKKNIKIETKDLKTSEIQPVSVTCFETMQNIELFKNQGISLLEKLNEKDLESMIQAANNIYYNTKQTLMTDNEYDILRTYVENKYPKNIVLKQVGAPITSTNKKDKVILPYQMPSMDKIKPDTNALQIWSQKYKGPYVISCKLDGVSGMYSLEGSSPKLYTRGDGKVGQDITHLLPALNLPTLTATQTNKVGKMVIRGEFILPKKVFEEKYKDTFANPRNLVSGIINSKNIDIKAKDLHFVAYEIISPPMKPSTQLLLLENLGFEVVKYIIEPKLTNELLSAILLNWRNNYSYEIDGIIVSDDDVYERKEGNPDHAFAFKMVISDQIAEAKVVDVIWTPSKSGYLKPRVRIEPIKIGGVTIEYATGFNGNFIETNKIGIGALIQLTRSGDVIPHIISVITPAEKAKMPDMPYVWNDTHVDVVLENVKEDQTVIQKNITDFFKGIEVDSLSLGNVKRIMDAGFDSVAKILKMKKTDFEKVEGFQKKMVDKIYDGIQSQIIKASLLDIMVASNLFGRGLGEKKLKPILETYPNILESKESSQEKIEMLMKINGIGRENAKSFVENIHNFMEFLKETKLENKLHSQTTFSFILQPQDEIDSSHVLYNKHIIMSKVRDKKIIEELKKVGGILDDNIGKNTFVLIVKSHEDESNKTKYAKTHGIPIMTPEEFSATYLT
jgi:NAD-dependent DNA ligase